MPRGACFWTVNSGLLVAVLALGCAPPPSPPVTSADQRKPAEAKPAPKADPPSDADEVDDLIKQLKGDPAAPVRDPEKRAAQDPAPAPAVPEARPPLPERRKAAMPAKVKVPPYFNELGLTEEQQDKIRRIAGSYDPVIQNLQDQLSAARRNPFGRTTELWGLPLMIKKRLNQRLKAMEDVLTEEQRAKLRKLRAANAAPADRRPRAEPANESEKTSEGLTQAEVDVAVKAGAEKGWRPTAIKGYAKGKESRFDIVWQLTRNRGRWSLYSDMSAEGFAKRREELAKEGFEIEVQSRWRVDDEERFAAIWFQK
jgi:hypothetical protein